MPPILTEKEIQELQAPLLQKLNSLALVDQAHGVDHVLRVSYWSLNLLESECRERKLDFSTQSARIAIYSGLLHDCYPVAKNSPERSKSADLSAKRAGEWLREMNVDEGLINEVVIAIEDHSYSAGRKARSIYGECLQDADRLEALGALGLVRTIAVGVSMGAEFFHPTDPWAKNRPLNDIQYSVDHFFTKLFKLADGFNTRSGRREAEVRTRFLRDFLDQLRWEIGREIGGEKNSDR